MVVHCIAHAGSIIEPDGPCEADPWRLSISIGCNLPLTSCNLQKAESHSQQDCAVGLQQRADSPLRTERSAASMSDVLGL
jgi:hypothetical protein